MSAEPPALVATDLSIALDGRVALESLTFETRGERVLLVGGWSPLVAVLSGLGEVTLRSGELSAMGRGIGKHRTICGVAPLHVPLPPRMAVRDYLTWAARLRGEASRSARLRAEAIMTRLELSPLGKRRLQALSWLERRAVVLAQSLASDPPLVVVESPFEKLDEPGSATMLGLLGRATEGRAAVVTLPALTLGGSAGALASQASDLLVMHDGRLVLQARPAEIAGQARVFAVTVAEGAEALQALLVERGAAIEGGAGRFTVRFEGGAGTAEILAAARACDAAVIGCEPLIR